jgi:glycerol kinase
MTPVASAQEEFAQIYPDSGWVEHDAEVIWATTLSTVRAARRKRPGPRIAAIGITNQRETVVLWDRDTGAPVHNAIVWQDRRTASMTAEAARDGHEPMVQQKTGLLLDPYFSGTKLAWLLDNVEGARQKAEAGKLPSAPSTAG